MSRDIRSYFSKKASLPTPTESPVVKRKAMRLSSDEEEVASTPKEKQKNHRRKRRISDSDEEKPSVKSTAKKTSSKTPEAKRAKKDEPKKAVDISACFGNEPKRVERKKPKKESAGNGGDCVILSDDDFETSIAGLDDSQLGMKKGQTPEKKDKSKSQEANLKSPKKEASKGLPKITTPKEPTPQKKSPTVTPKKEADIHKREIKVSPLSDFGLNQTPNVKDSPVATPKTKAARKVDLNASVLSDEERHERKRMTAILYQKYKNRTSVINPGSKEIPKGKPNCLTGLTFLVTGILESMERDEANSVIKELGGKISSTVGKRLNYMVVGEEAGPKKLVTAEELGIKILSEDELFDLIREKSGNLDKSKNKTKVSTTTAESGGKSKEGPTEKAVVKREEKKHQPEPDKVAQKRNVKEEFPAVTVKKEKRVVIEEEFPAVTVKEEKWVSPRKKMKSEPMEKETKFQTTQIIRTIDEESMAWVDKYKPVNLKQIIGQQGAASNCVKLVNWLSKWHSNHNGKKKLQKPNPWAKNDDGAFYKAALLSGPPGIGKTTTATLVCKELGFDAVEFNASDTRSKKLLKEEVSDLLNNKSLYGYFHGGKETVSKNHVLIMDEVDGMAGNEDRGGIQELIGLIKDSSVPIICMCNDRNHQKMRSLVNYCYDLRFNKPRLEQIKGAIMSICFKEKIKLPAAKIEEIISATNNDIRQTLNHLSLLSVGRDLKLDENRKDSTAKKDLKLGPWDVVRKVFSAEEHKTMSLEDRADLFFHDYSMGPLFVQQNYLSVAPKVPKAQVPRQVALTANSLSLGDLIEKRIRKDAAWSLLPVQAMFSSVMPGEHMKGHFTGQINFPGWLGKNSKRTKRSRMAQEIHDHTRARTSGSRLSVRLDYAPFLLNAICLPLKTKGMDGIEESLNVIKEYRLLREDLDSLIELTTWPGKKSPMDAVSGVVKAALTRAYNKQVLAYSYSAMANVKKKRAEASDELEELEEDEETIAVIDDGDDEEEEKLENDALIKAKKRTTGKAASKTEKPKATAGSSKGKGSGSRSKK